MKKITALVLLFLMFPLTALAGGDVDVSLKTSESFNVKVSCDEGTAAMAFVYTYKKSASGINALCSVKKYDIPFGGTVEFAVNPPEDGFTEKLAVFDRITLAPLCAAYEYPYIINVSAETLGFRLKDYGNVDKDGKNYLMNEYDVSEFQYAEDDYSAVTLLAKSVLISK